MAEKGKARGTPRPKLHTASGLPGRQQILDYIATSDQPAGKREIAKHFHLNGADKIALKSLLKDMADEGLIDSAPGRAFHKMGGVPKVTVLRVVEIDGNQAIAVPENWQAEGVPPPKLRLLEKGRRDRLSIGDRVLARTEEAGQGWVATPIKKLLRGNELTLGVIEKGEDGKLWLAPVDKRIRRSTPVSDAGKATPGQLVLAENTGRPPRITAKVSEILGDPFAPRAFSLIAIHKHGIPTAFPEAALVEAVVAAALPITGDYREDLRHLPIIAIDPADARDHDDAIWAALDSDPGNPGGYKAIVAIADVSFYVRSGGEIDREARKRGNSVYFPDRVVPMLPEILSADVCSLIADVDRAAMACHLTIDAKGNIRSWRFTRAMVRLAAVVAYEDAQAEYDNTDVIASAAKQSSAAQTGLLRSARNDELGLKAILTPLWDCWKLLAKARAARNPLDLDLPERVVKIDEAGRISHVGVRERLDAHRLVEDYMIAANVAAAKALEAKKSPVVYRVHEVPSREKLMALKDFVETFGLNFALGQVVTPATFNHLLSKVTDEAQKPIIMEQVLRSQTQAYYGPRNQGHFGLSLGSYAHFTSPIRRYSDLLVHRSLVDSYGLEAPRPQADLPPRSGLSDGDTAKLDVICKTISGLERRAMEAERETMDRYVAAYLALHVGELHRVRITGVQSFGFFVTVVDLGGDGLVPVSTLGAERFHYDEREQVLEGELSGDAYRIGQFIELRLVEANPVSGALKFELPEGGNYLAVGRDEHRRGFKRPAKHAPGRRGRPANIRHKGR